MRWYLLVHQLPPRPLYLRAKVRNRLAKVGALALKNSVYVLPLREDCLEDLQWIAQEAVAGGGEAWVCQAEFVGVSDEALIRQFQKERDTAYAAVKDEIAQALSRLRSASPQEPGAALLRVKKRFEEAVEVDFFGAPMRKEAEAMLRTLETRIQGEGRQGRGTRRGAARHADLVGRTWVTRRDVKVDRIASAWLIRRFIDPGARFRFIDPKTESARPGELSFDMVGGDFTHEGERCTFETLLHRLGLDDRGLAQIAQVVHDVDLKDGKFARPDAPGLQQLILGLVRGHADDAERAERGGLIFDALYASFQAPPPGTGKARRTRKKKRSAPAATRSRR